MAKKSQAADKHHKSKPPKDTDTVVAEAAEAADAPAADAPAAEDAVVEAAEEPARAEPTPDRAPKQPSEPAPEPSPKHAAGITDAAGGMPYTLYFPRRGGYAAADIEYPAPLPRTGDTIEFIDVQGRTHRYDVIEVVHTFQAPSDHPESVGLLRTGLPAVYLARARRKRRRPS